MTKPLNKGTKARLRRVVQATDKAADFLYKARGETYNLPQYNQMIDNALQLINQIHALAEQDSKASAPENPPVVDKGKKPKPDEGVQLDIEDDLA